jgi:carbohydrate diacid regulator
MITNQILQSTIEGITNISRTELCVFDVEGKVLASTLDTEEEAYTEVVLSFIDSSAEVQEMSDYQLFKVDDETDLEYILLVKGSGNGINLVGKMASFQLQNLLVAYKERFDQDNFIKNLLLDNLLLIDIYNRAKKLHIETEVKRIVYIVETQNEKDSNAYEILRTLFPPKSKDFITAVDEKNIIIVKQIKDTDTHEDIMRVASTMLDMLNTEAMSRVHISVGTVIDEIKEVSKSYKEAKMALDVGKIFYSEKNIVAYSNLGIGRLIYQLPLPLCKMYIREIFGNKSPDNFEDEMLTTINKFFENNLNVSETSRQLFIHRNTLVYRLDKIQKQTGLDIRIFEDSITFKIAMMVVKYMKYMETLDY